jgi:hypothetical protein
MPIDSAIDFASKPERELHDAIRVRHRQRPERDGMEQGHERRRHADAQRQHEDHRGAEDPRLAERPRRIPAIGGELLERGNTAAISIGLGG